MILEPRLDPGEFDRLKAERLNDILQARADPGRLADERFLGQVYADGAPYGRLSAGSPESVEPLSVADVQAHHAASSAPDVAHVIVAGAVEPAAAVAAVEARFGDWTGTGRGHRSIEAAERGGPRIVLVDRPGSVQSELRVGHLGIDRAHPRYFDAMVLAALLGGVFGSRLNKRLREELGYTYGARCAFDPRRAAGPFTATAAVQTEVTVDAIRELLAQLRRIREETPEERELAEVRDFLVGVFPLRFETTAGNRRGDRAGGGVRPAEGLLAHVPLAHRGSHRSGGARGGGRADPARRGARPAHRRRRRDRSRAGGRADRPRRGRAGRLGAPSSGAASHRTANTACGRRRSRLTDPPMASIEAWTR